MRSRGVSEAELLRRTRLVRNTVAKIWTADGTVCDANLVNISFSLGWHPHYLVNILYREEYKNQEFRSPMEEAFRNDVLDQLAEIDRKISLIVNDRNPDVGGTLHGA
jgi:hypothetical protein